MRSSFRNVLALTLVLTAFSAGAQHPEKTITPERLCNYISRLASDEFLGRNTPSPGLDSAAAYIAAEFRNCGLEPVNGSHYQTFYLCKKNLGEPNTLAVVKNGVRHELKLKTGFVPFDACSSGKVDAPVVFAGYGITAPEYKYDDYAGLDVAGKWVLVIRSEPQGEDSSSVFDGTNSTRHASVEAKMRNAARHGAAGILIVNGPLRSVSLKPKGFPWPSLSKIIPADALPFGMCGDADTAMPVLHVGEEMVSLLFGSVDSLRRIQAAIDSTLIPSALEFKDAVVSADITITVERMSTQNVVGVVRGTDPSGEVLVIGAHYDHVGYMKAPADSVTDSIFNGADDNASGTAGVMAVAKAFSRLKKPPERSVLFILFAGEEKGLFGSRYYVSHPLFPLDRTAAMLNLDMIGRNGTDSLSLVGAPVSPDIAAIARKENRKTKLTLTDDSDFLGGSDHYPFYRKKIPFMFFFSGIHRDYHTPADNPDRIDCPKAARVSQLVFRTALSIADSDEHYRVIEREENFNIFE